MKKLEDMSIKEIDNELNRDQTNPLRKTGSGKVSDKEVLFHEAARRASAQVQTGWLRRNPDALAKTTTKERRFSES